MRSRLRRSRYLPIQCFRSTLVSDWYSERSRPGLQLSFVDQGVRVFFHSNADLFFIHTERSGMPRCAIASSYPYRLCKPDLASPRLSGSHFFVRRMPMKGPIMSTMSLTNISIPETGFLRQPQVLTFVSISKSTLWRRIGAGTFPAPVKLSPRVTAWGAEDVRRWIAEQGAQSKHQHG